VKDTNTHAQVPQLEFVSRPAHSRALICHTHQHRPGTRYPAAAASRIAARNPTAWSLPSLPTRLRVRSKRKHKPPKINPTCRWRIKSRHTPFWVATTAGIKSFSLRCRQCRLSHSVVDGLTGGSSFSYAHSDVSMYEYPRYYRNNNLFSSVVNLKDEQYIHPGGDEPLIYLGAAAPHAGKILPIKRFGERMPLLVQDECFLASTGQMDQKEVCLKAGFGTEKLQMTRIAPLAYSQYETRRNANGRPATVFVHAPGSIMETNLGANKGLHVYTSAIVALIEGVTLNPP